MRKEEYYLHKAICHYISWHYKEVIYTTDLSGIRLNIGLAKQIKELKSSRGIPDLLILQPNNQYHGLFLEIKSETSKILTKGGYIKKDLHLMEQYRIISRLKKLNYAAFFVCSFDAAKNIIDKYMANNQIDNSQFIIY